MNALTKTRPRTAAEPAAVDPKTLHDRIVALRARERALLAEQIALHENGAEEVPPKPGVTDANRLAMTLAAGVDVPAEAVADLGSRLYQVRREREAIEKAIDLIDVQAQALHARRAERELERRGGEWRSLLRETAITIIRLQKLNRARDQLAKEIRGKSAITIPGAEFPPGKLFGFGYGDAGYGGQDFLTMIVRLGIMTTGEIERERAE